MDILKAEIARKRKLLEEKNLLVCKYEPNLKTYYYYSRFQCPDKKYFKRGDLLAKEQEEYCQKYGTNKNEDITNSTQAPEGTKSESDVEGHSILPRSEVISRLRDRSEPILLFGETEIDAFKRLRKCELLEPEVNKGFRNDFQEAMEQVDQAYLDELLTSSEDAKSNKKSADKEKTVAITYGELQEMAKDMGRGERERDMTVIVHFIQFILKLWQEQLQDRPAEEKRGTKGKLAGATYTQTQEYLKPLLRKKYIQGLKRLMTKCQEYYPTDPSRCVEYAAFGTPPQMYLVETEMKLMEPLDLYVSLQLLPPFEPSESNVLYN
ncbi:pre-mRNA-splicing factor 18 [Asbolus verrucosus]|uniref:Pre-mRNA-splicing factor 18 n=1 Tax=Asbolus verrucosus TaxID=1661398 RepID=A0A482W5F5_ASBVE|nr:pre-mRNA-splicing factor 18 [Asbolus verrucosus]